MFFAPVIAGILYVSVCFLGAWGITAVALFAIAAFFAVRNSELFSESRVLKANCNRAVSPHTVI